MNSCAYIDTIPDFVSDAISPPRTFNQSHRCPVDLSNASFGRNTPYTGFSPDEAVRHSIKEKGNQVEPLMELFNDLAVLRSVQFLIINFCLSKERDITWLIARRNFSYLLRGKHCYFNSINSFLPISRPQGSFGKILRRYDSPANESRG